MLAIRKKMNDKIVMKDSLKIVEYLFNSPLFIHAKHIMTYIGLPNEVQTVHLVTKATLLQKHVSVPVCNPETINLFPSQITDLNILEKGYFGLLEPKKEFRIPIDVNQLDLIIVPGVVFDYQGNRIGHGKGYYDRFLKDIPSSTPKIAFAFQYQVVKDKWPVDSWDIPMDGLITEKGWIYKNF